jgi:hypothetical protein
MLNGLAMEAHPYNPSYSKGRGRRITSLRPLSLSLGIELGDSRLLGKHFTAQATPAVLFAFSLLFRYGLLSSWLCLGWSRTSVLLSPPPKVLEPKE